MKTLFVLLIINGILFNFLKNPNIQQETRPYPVDVERALKDSRSVPLSMLGRTIEYIPLETSPACLIKSVANVFVTDSLIYVSDREKLLLFSRNGRFIKQIGSVGRGPGEYERVADFIVDLNNREILVLSNRKITIYNPDGKYLRDFKFDFPCNQFIMAGPQSLMLHPFNLPVPSSEPVYSWYIMDKYGIIQSKMINTFKRSNRGLVVPTSPLYTFNGSPRFMEFGIDTLYYFEGHSKKIYAVFNLGKMKMNPDPTMDGVLKSDGKIYILDIKEDNKFIYSRIMWNLTDSLSYIFFNKKTGESVSLKEKGFINDIDGGLVFWPRKIQDDGIIIDYADAMNLIRKFKENKSLSIKPKDIKKAENFKQVACRLDETSNPVIIILRK